jgi:hypothetical protein
MKGLFFLLILIVGGFQIFKLLDKYPGLENDVTFGLVIVGALMIILFLLT